MSLAEKSNCKRCGDQLEFQMSETATLNIGGKEVGISCLDDVMNEVMNLGLGDDALIRKELLDRVKQRDYVPPKAEGEYSAALMEEYARRRSG